MAPPVGLYEHKFNNGAYTKSPSKEPAANRKSPDPKNKFLVKKIEINERFIHKPYEKAAVTQAFSCLAETREVDFSLS